MKHSCLRRFTTTLLALAMIAGMFTVCGFGAMAEENTSQVVGTEIYGTDTSVDDYTHLMQIDVSNVTIKKDHQIKLVYKMYAPGGPNGKLMFRVYGDYGCHGALADDDTIWDKYNAAEIQVDETYGYQYKLVEKTYNGPQTIWTGESFWAEGQTEKVMGFFNYIWILESNITENNPVQFYEMSVYDVDDNNRLMYTISGEDLNNATAHEGVSKRAISTDTIAVQAVIDKINALPAAIQVSDEEAITAAQTAYNALTEAQKDLVNNLDKLTQAQNDLRVLKENIAAANEVIEKINAIDTVNPNETAVTAARTAYDALTEAQQALVTNFAKLEAAEQVLAKPDNVWNYKDLLDADTTAAMEGEYPDDVMVELPVGFQVDVDKAGGFNEGDLPCPMADFLTNDVTLTEGHGIRSVIRAYFPNGAPAAIVHHIYVNYNGKVLDDGSSEISPVLKDETYGYTYQEFILDGTVSSAVAGTNPLHLYLFNAGNPNYSQYPLQIFGWDLYDTTTGETLFSYDGSDFLGVKQAHESVADKDCAPYHSPVMYNPVYTDQVVGYTAVDYANEVGCWTKFDIYTKFDKAPVKAGDILRMGVKIWKDDGYNELQPFSMVMQYFANAFTEPDSMVRETLDRMEIISENSYEDLEEFVDPAYGFPYKLAILDHVVTADEVDLLNAKGVSPLIGHDSARNYNQSSLSLYGYYVYNVTQDVYYVDLDGVSLMSMGGTGTKNEPITLRNYNTDYATAGAVKAKRSAIFSSLTAASETTGQYSYTFDVQGENGKQYRFKAYALDDQSKTIQVGQKTFTASGEQESVVMTFNLRDDYAGKSLCFGIEAINGALSVNTVTFDGRTGDYGDNDEYENQLMANVVIDQIDALPATITLSDEAAINEARTAYNALSEDQKALVSNLDKLTKAETDLQARKEDTAAAQAVIDKIHAIDADNPTRETVDAARTAYDALTAPQKDLVGADVYKKLTDAEEKLAVTYGDVNGDGEINASDALLALQHSVELTRLEGNQFTAADVNQNGTVDATDALYILQYSVQLIPSLPVASK